MKTAAQLLLDKLDRTRAAPKNASPKISAEIALRNFEEHIAWLLSRHVRNPYSEHHLVMNCFGKERILKNRDEANAYCRLHLSLAVLEFTKLAAEIRNAPGVLAHTLKRYGDIVRDYLFDLKWNVEHLERQKDSNYTLFYGGKNYGVHTWEVFLLSRQLAMQSAFRKASLHIDHKVSQIASIFVLRQALEAKFERLIGVDIYNASGHSPKLRHGFHYDFIAERPAFFTFKAVDFKVLKKIYEWCNEVVHGVFQPYAWQIAHAHAVCGGLFNPGPLVKGRGWSIHNAVQINNLDEMQRTFMEHFNQNYDHGIWAVEAMKPEADVVS